MAMHPDSDRFTGRQLRAARALLGISAEVFAERAGLSVQTIRRYEQTDLQPLASQARTLDHLCRVFEALTAFGCAPIDNRGLVLTAAPVAKELHA